VAHLLLIDDDTVIVAEQVQQAFRADRVEVAASGALGLELVRQAPPDVILLDLRLPDASGIDIYRALRAIDARVPVIFITTAKNADTAIEAMKLGAFDYLYKPLDLAQLRRVVGQALEIARLREPVALEVPNEANALLGTSQAMLDIYKAIGRVAAQDVTVLITGDSGTGKELVARAIYQHSARSQAPFLALNCAAIPDNLLESELFGYEKGAFTGADRRRIGKFEQCNGGTLLLDEIGDMPTGLQAKILRVLQDQTFERVGGTETIHTNVRVLASTHRELKNHATFRSDLYYRLGVFTIHLPALRDRSDDIPTLVDHFVRRFSRELGREINQVPPETLTRLAAYGWPGNIRELQSVIRQALLHASGTVLLPAFLPDLTVQPRAPGFDLEAYIRDRLAEGGAELSAETHREVDRMLLTLVLEHTGGNYRDAAKVLGISRQTLRVRLRSLGIQVTHAVTSDDDTD
jgi:DNA-binding NtrC family response regulator